MHNSNLCRVIFVFYCTRIFESKMASGRHLKGILESTFIGFLVCRIVLRCNIHFDFQNYFKFKMATRFQLEKSEHFK